jgi:cytochrome d ubiquinol oxidase subunit I
MSEASDMILLARLQFGFTIAFHILFPAFTIGLASYLATLKALWLATGRAVYQDLYDFWLKPFALSFGMGVVSGVVLSYQIGTNWSGFAAATGNVLGPLFGYEVLTAFFLEASFLAIMLFGRGRVGDAMHLVATVVVAVGTLISAFWILAANSWMHTPAGHTLSAGRFYPQDWLAVIFNPSLPYRFTHMVFAAYLSTAMVVAAVGAYHLRREAHNAAARVMLRMALPFIAVVGVLQVIAGHEHGVNVFEHQPVKLAAMEGHWESHDRAAPLILFALPDAEAQDNAWELAVPALGSLVVTGSVDGAIRGLKSWPADEHPPVAIVFWSFRLMVALGILMLLIGCIGSVLLRRNRIAAHRGFLAVCVACAPAGFAAVLAGWVTAEVGRQPYVVQGLLRTAQAASPVTSTAVGLSLIVFAFVYLVVFGAGLRYLLRTLHQVPRPDASTEAGRETPLSPWEAAQDGPGGR